MVGKDFKALSKVVVMCLKFVGVDRKILNAWNHICYITKFVNSKKLSENDLVKFSELINIGVISIGETFDSLKRSVKLHLCLHLEQNIRRHGVPLNYSTECFESINHVMRNFIWSTNQQQYCNDALGYYYKPKRMKFLLDNESNPVNLLCKSPFDQLQQFEQAELYFSSTVFTGNFDNFLVHSNFSQNRTLTNFLQQSVTNFKLLAKIQNERSSQVFLFNSGKIFLFDLGIEIENETVSKYFMGRELVETNKTYQLAEVYTICEFGCTEIVNFQHDCVGLHCQIQDKKINHSQIHKYLRNNWIF